MRADTKPVGYRLRSVRGHLDGVIRMVEDDRYCIDVLRSACGCAGSPRSGRRDILGAHLRRCVLEAVVEGKVDHTVYELMAATFGAATGLRPQHHCQHADVTPSVAATVS